MILSSSSLHIIHSLFIPNHIQINAFDEDPTNGNIVGNCCTNEATTGNAWACTALIDRKKLAAYRTQFQATRQLS